MQKTLRGFAAVLLGVWLLVCIAAIYYANLHSIATGVVLALLPAILLEAGLYVAAGTPSVRALIDRLRSPLRIALGLVALAVLPYLLYSIPTGTFDPLRAISLLGLVSLVSCWYLWAKPAAAADIALMVLMAAVYVGRVFQWIYPDPAPHIGINVLGTLMWIRTGVLSILCIRRMPGINYSLAPGKRDWWIGLLHFLFFLPVGFVLAATLHFVRPEPIPITTKLFVVALATFLGTLWVLAAMEEFFFRGMLQQILTRELHGTTAGVIGASVLFGCAHLWFRTFPNWRFALLAGLAGLFYGRAYVKAGSVRASMVTHALVVTTWRVFLA